MKGKIDYGNYIITAVNHQMDNTLTYENNFTAIPAETSIPENTDPYFVRTSSNQLGMVEDNKDPEKLGRVKISFWWMEGKQTTPWIRIATPYINKEAGFYFIPAKNTRVLVGFEAGDEEKPYILGTLFDKDANPDPDWAGNRDESNEKINAIRTAAGNTIEFDDSDGGEKITMYDRDDKYRITLDSANGTLTVHSDGTLNLNASKINIKAEKEFPLICEKSEVTVTKDMDTTVGNNVSFQAGKDFSVTAAGDNKNTAGKKIKLDGLEVDISALGSLKSSAKGTYE